MSQPNRARCSEMDPDLWIEDEGTNFARAVHECTNHCPVIEACGRAALDNPAYVAGTVRAGLVWAANHKRGAPIVPAEHQPFPIGCRTCKPRQQRRLSREALERVGR